MNTLTSMVVGWVLALAGVAALAIVIEHALHNRKITRQDRLFDDMEAATKAADRPPYAAENRPRSRA